MADTPTVTKSVTLSSTSVLSSARTASVAFTIPPGETVTIEMNVAPSPLTTTSGFYVQYFRAEVAGLNAALRQLNMVKVEPAAEDEDESEEDI